MPRHSLMTTLQNKKHLKNVGPIRHCERPHAHSPDVATDATCASMSTTMLTTTTTMRDRGDRYGPMEWAQQSRAHTLTTVGGPIPGKMDRCAFGRRMKLIGTHLLTYSLTTPTSLTLHMTYHTNHIRYMIEMA